MLKGTVIIYQLVGVGGILGGSHELMNLGPVGGQNIISSIFRVGTQNQMWWGS